MKMRIIAVGESDLSLLARNKYRRRSKAAVCRLSERVDPTQLCAQLEKHLHPCRCPIRAEHFISYPNPDSYLLAVFSAVCFHETGFPRVLLFDWEHMLWYDYL